MRGDALDCCRPESLVSVVTEVWVVEPREHLVESCSLVDGPEVGRVDRQRELLRWVARIPAAMRDLTQAQ
jgi:hypothetical protein